MVVSKELCTWDSRHPNSARLSDEAYERLRTKVVFATDRLSDDQLLAMADMLHEGLRTRSRHRSHLSDRVQASRPPGVDIAV